MKNWVNSKKKKIKKKLVNIIRYFLLNETMKIKIGNNYSEIQNIPFGVP